MTVDGGVTMSGIKRHKKLVVVLVLVLAFFLWKTWDGYFTPERWAKTDGGQRGKLAFLGEGISFLWGVAKTI